MVLYIWLSRGPGRSCSSCTGSRVVVFLAGDAPWLTRDDLDFYANEFEHSGLTGALNRYRNVDRDWEDLAA